jgi:hypothetical protein
MREDINWRWPLSCVHSVMIVFSAQRGEVGGGEHALPLSLLLPPRLELCRPVKRLYYTEYQSFCPVDSRLNSFKLGPPSPKQNEREKATCTLHLAPSPLLSIPAITSVRSVVGIPSQLAAMLLIASTLAFLRHL